MTRPPWHWHFWVAAADLDSKQAGWGCAVWWYMKCWDQNNLKVGYSNIQQNPADILCFHMRKAVGCWYRHGISLLREIISGHAGDGFRHIWRSVSLTRIHICHQDKIWIDMGILLCPKGEAHYIDTSCRSEMYEWWYFLHWSSISRSWRKFVSSLLQLRTAKRKFRGKVGSHERHERHEFLSESQRKQDPFSQSRVAMNFEGFAPSMLECWTSLRQSFGQKKTVRRRVWIL